MEIVINIPKSHYKALQQMRKGGLGFYHQAILNGTVLPEGHGDLKDVSKINYQAGVFVGSEGPLPVIHKIATIEMIRDYLPTIVAADVESEVQS